MRDYISERAISIGEYIIDTGATVRGAAKKFHVSKSTVLKDVTERLVKINPQLAEKVHSAFMDHHIYTVLVNKGIRVAVCSVSVSKVKGLAKKMKDIINSLSE